MLSSSGPTTGRCSQRWPSDTLVLGGNDVGRLVLGSSGLRPLCSPCFLVLNEVSFQLPPPTSESENHVLPQLPPRAWNRASHQELLGKRVVTESERTTATAEDRSENRIHQSRANGDTATEGLRLSVEQASGAGRKGTEGRFRERKKGRENEGKDERKKNIFHASVKQRSHLRVMLAVSRQVRSRRILALDPLIASDKGFLKNGS